MFRFLEIHTVPPEKEGSTWLQLFFDLVYVAILVEIGARLGHDLAIHEFVIFVFLFIAVWWSWLEFVDYGRHYPIDDIGQRILTVFYMAVMLIMAFDVHILSTATLTTFIITYGISKFILALMYVRAWVYYPDYRQLTSGRSLSFLIVGLVWIAIALTNPSSLWLWGFVVVLNAVVPHIISFVLGLNDRARLSSPPIKYHFMLHRFGELTIIVLGEFFIKLVISSSGRELSALNYLMGAALLAISLSIWWLYFDHLEHANLRLPGTRLFIWTYSHLPFMAAISAYGVIGNQIFAERPHAPLEATQRLILTVGLSVALLAFGVIEWASQEKEEPLSRPAQPRVRLIGAAVLVILGFLGGSLNVGWFISLVAVVMLLQVWLDAMMRLRRPDQADARLLVER